ncbi:hypothetical protein [Ramlibacter albus]|uniref:Ankyrin repeat domain-containing protein n=1 Tax=Ramlibacter albus TaxID=2079448 RepID=A0A923MC67_9BURK|nr:hypothetical protein [Ramlibacter albus]MBC5767688.1 hypothetical protein [Ramlibacter albus]
MRAALRHFLLLLACSALSGPASFAFAGEPRTPHQVIADLRQQMYLIGDTTGSLEEFVQAEQQAGRAIRDTINAGGAARLVEKNREGQTPLMAAAFMGYSRVIDELLKSAEVRKSIDDAGPRGLTAWLYTSMAPRQAMWVCNPKLVESPSSLVPLLATQYYYRLSVENPYRKSRLLLEQAGARPDPDRARQIWHDLCIVHDGLARARIQGARDTLDAVLAEGAESLTRYIAEQHSRIKAAGITESDIGSYTIVDKKGGPGGIEVTLHRTDGKWVMVENDKGATDFRTSSNKELLELVHSFPGDIPLLFEIACIQNAGQAFCRLNKKDDPTKVGYALVRLATGEPIAQSLRRLTPPAKSASSLDALR